MSDERPVSKERSPNYPAIGLPAAIEAVRKLWNKEKRTSVPPEVAVNAIGYSSLSGAARTALASLRQYGLIEAGGGAVTVSPLAIDILVHGEQTPEYKEAVRIAAGSPAIFSELLESHGAASDQAITAYLITKRRFSPDGARKLAKALRETMTLANRAGEGYSRADEAQETPLYTDMTTPSIAVNAQPQANQQVMPMHFPLGNGVRAEIRFVGGEITPSHIQRLGDYLKVATEALAEGS